tara:strand:+ start:359 stop:559 length:201 start_codon:yes stop_codon:yes gene_type:complete
MKTKTQSQLIKALKKTVSELTNNDISSYLSIRLDNKINRYANILPKTELDDLRDICDLLMLKELSE